MNQVIEPARMDLIESDGGGFKLSFENARGHTVTIGLSMDGILQLSNTLDKFMIGKTLDAVQATPGQPTIPADSPLVIATAIDLVRFVETGACALGVVPIPPHQPFRVGLSPELAALLKEQLPSVGDQTAH